MKVKKIFTMGGRHPSASQSTQLERTFYGLVFVKGQTKVILCDKNKGASLGGHMGSEEAKNQVSVTFSASDVFHISKT